MSAAEPPRPCGSTRAARRAAGPPAALPTVAAPDERGWGRVPAPDGGGQPVHDLLGSFGVVAIQGAPDEDALDGLGHVQPGAA